MAIIAVPALMPPFPIGILVFALQVAVITKFLSVMRILVPLTVAAIFICVPLMIILVVAVINALVVAVAIVAVVTILSLQSQGRGQNCHQQQ